MLSYPFKHLLNRNKESRCVLTIMADPNVKRGQVILQPLAVGGPTRTIIHYRE